MKEITIAICLVLVATLAAPFAFAAERTVTDLVGRKLVLVENPDRIVALAPSVTEIIFALGQEQRLVGVTQYSDFPKAAVQYPKVGSYVNLDLERIFALQPDFCIGVKDGNPKDVVDRLEELDIPVYVVNPRGLASVMETVSAIGDILDAEERAQAVIANMQKRIDAVDQVVQQSQTRPRVFFQIGISPIVSVGDPTFINELIVRAGGTNVAAGSVAYPRYSREQVLGMKPEVIVITSMARYAIFQQVKAEWEQWPEIPAVRNGHIFMQDSNLFDRPTPRLVDGLELLSRMVHPELFKGAQ
ncbi:MAG: cobalamin-binding protein [Thermodesulfobacteriota bacterium]